MKTPVFRFEAELLTDAPLEVIEARLSQVGPGGFRSLRPFKAWQPLVTSSTGLELTWQHRGAWVEESGRLTLGPDSRGTHLRLEGRLKGWAAFLLLGWLRWRTDRLLDRFVEEL